MAEVVLSFDRGTLLLEGLDEGVEVPGFVVDERAGGRLRAPAIWYRRGLGWLLRAGHEVDDQARAYEELQLSPRRTREPYPHQAEALARWQETGRRGLVVLPTGAGKSYVAEMAIAVTGRSTLVVAPTIDLMNQWMNLLEASFGEGLVGGVGGGHYQVEPLTVTTYDSAYLHMERFGNRFGMIVFDECHHLPGPSYAQGAECAIAPFRLGLTATPERQDGSHALLDRLVGPEIYRRDIKELAGRYLAEYETCTWRVALTAEERQAYDDARKEYRDFVSAAGIRMSQKDGWAQFLLKSSQSRRGRSAWRAWREQKRIAMQSEAKLQLLGDLLEQHGEDQVIIFTADNDTVYEISRRFLVPAVTHQSPGTERREILKAFNQGRYRAVVTSKVLNEGVDMPAASVGIVLSGTASVREHVQRLGRILRRGEGKQALLHEVITAETAEEFTSQRRREHHAYR